MSTQTPAQDAPKLPQQKPLADVKLPEGGREATGLHTFLTVDETTPWGTMFTGVLSGTTTIKDRNGKEVLRYLVTFDAKEEGKPGETVVLPSHEDLRRRMEDVARATGIGARVVIAYLGIEAVEGVPVPMYRYKVKDYGLERPT